MKEQFILNFVLARSRLLNVKGEEVGTLHPPLGYQHGLELVRNLSLWPVEIQVKSSIQKRDQVHYNGADPGSWQFEAVLLPNHGSGEQFAPLECSAKTSGRDEIFSEFVAGGGYKDTLTLEVKIE